VYLEKAYRCLKGVITMSLDNIYVDVDDFRPFKILYLEEGLGLAIQYDDVNDIVTSAFVRNGEYFDIKVSEIIYNPEGVWFKRDDGGIYYFDEFEDITLD